MFLGFVLAVVSVATATKGRIAVAMLTPILALGMPILDTLLAIARRAWFGQSLFVGDRGHIHHRLLDAGLSHRNTVLFMYAFAAIFALLGIGVHFKRDRESALLFLLSLVAAGVLLRKVGYLMLPDTLGAGIAAASGLRERNRLIRSTLATLEPRLNGERRADTLALAIAEVARASGASEVELDLRPLNLDGPARTWRWDAGLHDADVIRQVFNLRTTDGRGAGTLEVGWTSAAWHPSAMPTIEVACIRLVDRYHAAPSEPDIGRARHTQP
jgi:UDP-GlcNAc:undecaprenyl-phosphate GlcNAc-1-phosphate transferase